MMDTDALIDAIIIDCNSLVSHLFSGHFVRFCGAVVQIVTKLGELKISIAESNNKKNKIIEELKRTNTELQKQAGLPAEGGNDHGAD